MSFASRAANPDPLGLALLRQTDPTLQGAGIQVAQPEAGNPAWEVNPDAVGLPASRFIWVSGDGTAATFPNPLGTESSHADGVGWVWYSPAQGLSPGLNRIANYEAGHFYNSIVSLKSAVEAQVVNQSFIMGDITPTEQQGIDRNYDTVAAQQNVLFVSAVGNQGPVSAPATCYNGLGVGAFGGSSSLGPTADNQRCKPDLTAPASATSFSAPLVSGAAALLLQAAARADGGTGTSSTATNIQTLKALLLNGAVKPLDWTNSPSVPLDLRYGAGVLNVFNSWHQLRRGKHPFLDNSTPPAGGPHPPTSTTQNINALAGWDFNTLSSTVNRDGVNHYFFSLTNGSPPAFTATITLAWNRQPAKTTPNDLNLFLVSAAGNILASSTSRVDNVEHLFIPALPPGRYDLQVLKNGGPGLPSNSESYALVFEFFAPVLAITRSDSQLQLSWPVAPAGFNLQSSLALPALPGNWSEVTNAPLVTNGLNSVLLQPARTVQFFRLSCP